jgi:outer membrane receptor protein involved in Fe transport
MITVARWPIGMFLVLLLTCLMTHRAVGQAEGAVAGRVRDARDDRSLAGAQLLVETVVGAVTDTSGSYRIRGVRPGWHRVTVRLIGYRGVVLDSVFVRAGATVTADFALEPSPVELEPLVVTAPVDEFLDPLATASEQKISASDLRDLPVSSLEEALALSAGSVGTSYRGGRIGEESFILDGLGIKNQLDAASGGLGLQLPPDFLGEASLVTNGFSARYGQALSGLVNIVTRDPGDRWSGRLAYESDRLLGGSLDRGLDRFVAGAGGPLAGHVGFVAAADVNGRLDDDPVNAPAPADPIDPRHATPYPLPHNSGERWNGAAKLVVPLNSRTTLRVLGIHSEDQRLLFDPVYKYDAWYAPAQRLRGDMVSGHVHLATDPRSGFPIIIDVRASRFVREFLRGNLVDSVDYAIGAITGSRFHFVGEDVARAQSISSDPIPGFGRPEASFNSPWGVPAFFFGAASNGDLAWNRFGETRFQLDMTYGGVRQLDLYAGGEYSAQQVRTWQRVLGYLPVGGDVPAPASAAFSPSSGAAYVEAQTRVADLAFTAGIRYDQFDAGTSQIAEARGSRRSLSPRFAVSTVLKGATVVVSYGRFTQAPDYQFLVDAAFDDSTRTGRFRRGNPDLGFEKANQYEFSFRVRPREAISVRAGVYVRRLDGLVASVPLGIDPDSSIFGNTDAGTVKGLELIAEREFKNDFGVRVAYTLQDATANSTDAFLITRQTFVNQLGDTIHPAKVEFPLDFDRRHTLTVIGRGKVPDGAGPKLLGSRPIAGLEAAIIFRLTSGLPYSRTDSTGDTLVGLPNSSRLPYNSTLDLLIRRALTIGQMRGGIYLDMRNLLNRRNIIAVRKDTGAPGPGTSAVTELAEEAYAAHPEPIPFESPRYRRAADLDGNGLIEGRNELFPLYAAAARDFTTPIFAYGTPRLVRLGIEFLF